MTLRERIRSMVMTANGNAVVMDRKLANQVMPEVLKCLNEKSFDIGHDQFDYDRPSDEYPDILYTALWIYVRPVVFAFLEEHHPNFHHRSSYMASEQRTSEDAWP